MSWRQLSEWLDGGSWSGDEDEGRWVPDWELTGYYDQAVVDGTNIGEWREGREGWAAEHHPGVEGGIWEDSVGIHWRPTNGGDW